MPNYLDLEPPQLLKVAEQHDEAAAKIRKWGEIPHTWLAEFEPTYGTLAEPVRSALVDYYNRRHDSAERQAIAHERARDQLIKAAAELARSDDDGGHDITQTGNFGQTAPPGSPAPAAPANPVAPVYTGGPDTPIANDPQPRQPAATTPDPSTGRTDGTGRPDQVPLPPAASAPPPVLSMPHLSDTSPSGATPASEYPTDLGISEPTATGADTNSAAGVTDGMMAAPLPTGPALAPAAVAAGGAGTAPSAPLSAGPFVAAVHAAENRRSLPPLVVGDRLEDDLVLARTLLAAILVAVADSAPGPEWAVAVWRTSFGPVIFLTSTEGRGWIPPGLLLPSEVALPWRWNPDIGTAALEAIAALEGTTDPARMLAEFGSKGSRNDQVRLSALVSSAAIPDSLRATLGHDVAIEDWVPAAESAVDLTVPGTGLVDRLALAGSDELLQQASTVPETDIRAKCLQLAQAADMGVQAAVSDVDRETAIHRALRRQILDALHSGRPIPAGWWGQLRAADDTAAAALRSRRVNVSYVSVDAHPDTPTTEALRDKVFQRRADALLLLFAGGEPDRQTLRDALYDYGQIVDHPLFPPAARAVAMRTAEATGTGRAVSNVDSGRGTAAVSVSSDALGGPPPSITELLRGPAESERFSEQRRAR
ncbi:type VII secretion target [Nocardia australiensis]|uniref:type VII secretion target n=1 Tax=Nocardia australiensis TaxID=2887191 RepID=UPI001D13F56D|nr:type VII secretion target [Nocardia australiensis]